MLSLLCQLKCSCFHGLQATGPLECSPSYAPYIDGSGTCGWFYIFAHGDWTCTLSWFARKWEGRAQATENQVGIWRRCTQKFVITHALQQMCSAFSTQEFWVWKFAQWWGEETAPVHDRLDCGYWYHELIKSCSVCGWMELPLLVEIRNEC